MGSRAGCWARGLVPGGILHEFEGIPYDHLEEAVSDLEALAERSPILTVAAVHVLKNELGDVSELTRRRELLYGQRFVLPGSRPRDGLARPWRALVDLLAWLAGSDAGRFRDRCDASFWSDVVPVLERHFGAVGEPLMNTVNEAIINYAEYSFKRWALRRRIAVHVFLTEDSLGYAIIRPLGTRLRVFNPLDLKEKSAETLEESRRGWGHTIIMRRALFISFDKSPRRRGLMIVVGGSDA